MSCNFKIILTGASGLIGSAIADALYKSGMNLVLACKRSQKLQDRYLSDDKSKRAYFWYRDLTNEKACRELVEYAVQQMGGVDVLINCAGVFNFSALEEMTYSRITDTISTNLLAPIYLTHLVLPYIKTSACPIIVNISSIAGFSSLPEGACYAASKWGLNGFIHSIREELRKKSIHICNISPCQVKTLSHHSDTAIRTIAPENIANAVILVLSYVQKTSSSIDVVL
ncbi:SDR family oxidoreductase [Yersinia wautersii]|uniref:Dehydrogenase n=1 Tax=Yersinia wautersii TaxID=1341643 RepID=A0ABM9TEZ4_9GAMM|nr:SDR family oxidoreductase [Yersinia wautersii]CRG50511.1 putative dehydrogenase [Yersinia wautersii]